MNDWLIEAIFLGAQQSPAKPLAVHDDSSISYNDVARLLTDADSIPSDIDRLPDPLKSLLVLLRERKSYSVTAADFGEQRHLEFSEQVTDFVNSNPGEFLTSSGSTGPAKSIYVTFAAQKVTAETINARIVQDPALDELIVLPQQLSSGAGRIRAAILRGATIHFVGTPIKPKLLVGALKSANEWAVALTPATWRFMKQIFGDKIWDLMTHVRSLEFGSAPLGKLEIDEIRQRLAPKSKLTMHYGLTEASRSFLRDLTESHEEGEIGKPNSYTHFRLHKLTDEEEAELLVSGPHTASLIHRVDSGWQFIDASNPWISTGDLVQAREGRGLVFCGRRDDLCDVGGRLVSPTKVETIIRHLGFDQDFVVVARRHEVLGDELVCVVNEGSADELRLHLAKTREHLEPHEVPTAVVAVARLPYLDSMKVDRSSIKRLVGSS